MIPNGTKVRVNNVSGDVVLRHVHGLVGAVEGSYMSSQYGEQRYTVLIVVEGLSQVYDLAESELEVVE